METQNLFITRLTEDDATFIVQLLNSPGWLQQIGDRGVRTIDDARSYLIKGPIHSYQEDGFGLMRVSLKTDDTPIGICGLIKRDALDDVDIGFALLPDYEGKGYGYEAAVAIMNLAVKLNMARVVAITLPTNIKSVRLLERLGLRFEKMIRLPGDEEELMLMSKQL
ncbi:MAG: GNAT family N-acetyltransferase [Flavipsychrobacter sp.]|nr:GNAT family N-acetyltransferase [Flavipsychrobacter sp.]